MFWVCITKTNKLKCQFYPPTRLTLNQKLHQSGKKWQKLWTLITLARRAELKKCFWPSPSQRGHGSGKKKEWYAYLWCFITLGRNAKLFLAIIKPVLWQFQGWDNFCDIISYISGRVTLVKTRPVLTGWQKPVKTA